MSNKRGVHRVLAFVLAALSCALGMGCSSLFGYDPLVELDKGPRRLRQIEPLDLSAVSSPGQGAESEPPGELTLTLPRCRALALENNLDLKVELISPTIARQSVHEAEGVLEPSLFAGAYYSRDETASGGGATRYRTSLWSGDVGVEFPLRTGGSITLDLPVSRSETEGDMDVDAAYTTDVGVSLSQPLLRGAGVRANTHAIRIAHYQSQIVEARTRLEVTRVIAAVDRVYWRLYAARRELEVRKNEYDLAAAQLERSRRMAEAGMAPEVEIIRAEAGVAERLEAIIVADNAIRRRERELKRVINTDGLPVQGDTVLVPATPPDPSRHQLDLARVTEAALQNRMELLELELQLARDASTIQFERSGALPFLAVDYTYSVNGLGPSEHDALDLLFDRRVEDHRVGFELVVPLGNRAAEARVRRALYVKAQTLATRQRRTLQIRQEVANALDELESNWQRIAAGRTRVRSAARNLEAEERQFGEGLRTSTEVLEAQTRLADAQSALVRAEAEYEIAKVDLAFASGMLLGEAAVSWEPIVPRTGVDAPLPPDVARYGQRPGSRE